MEFCEVCDEPLADDEGYMTDGGTLVCPECYDYAIEQEGYHDELEEEY